MQAYRDYAPTGFDVKGLAADDEGIADYGVFLIRTRDSEPLEESNFRVGLKRLGGESDTVQIHRFGHWACGWFEIIVVKPGTKEYQLADDMATKLAEDYPVLDEMDWSELECEINLAAGMVIDDSTGEWIYPEDKE